MQGVIRISEFLPLEGVSPKGGLLQVPDASVRKGQDAFLPPSPISGLPGWGRCQVPGLDSPAQATHSRSVS